MQVVQTVLGGRLRLNSKSPERSYIYSRSWMKSEYFYLNKFSSVKELQTGLKKYIHYYNHDRIKMKLKGLSPVQYRTQPLAA